MATIAVEPTKGSSILWTKLALGGDHDVRGNKESFLEVSNPRAPLPIGSVGVLPNFVSVEEAASLQEELSERIDDDSTWEGFDGPRRRVLGYDLNENETSIPKTLLKLQRRLKEQTGLDACNVKLEEYTPAYHRMAGQAYDPTVLSTFASHQRRESACPCQHPAEDAFREGDGESDDDASTSTHRSCSCFLVEIPLWLPTANDNDDDDGAEQNLVLVQNWNQPEIRRAICWHLRSPEHYTDVRLHLNTAIVKRSDLLTEWRSSRVLLTTGAMNATPITTTKIRILQFYNLASGEPTEAGTSDVDDTFGYVPSARDEIERAIRLKMPTPPLSDLLTIIITTSPIKSNPSTEVLERAMGSFDKCGPEFATQCRKVIVCDGYRTQLDDPGHEDEETGRRTNGQQHVSRKHSNLKQAMRNGIVTGQQADNYRQFKRNLRELCAGAGSFGQESVFRNAEVVELEERHGYGFALRHVLRNCNIATPFVCVVQHDRTFMRPTPVKETVRTMWLHANIKYVGFSMRSNLMYRDIFLGKYGSGLQQQQQEWNEMVLYLPELRVPATEYGPHSLSTRAMEGMTDKVLQNILALAETYKGSAQAAVSRQAGDEEEDDDCQPKLHQMSLTPTLFWYDNVHVCDTKHYRDFIFHPSYKMCARGGFVEDKLSPVLKRSVERMGLKEGHQRWGCYLLDDHSGMFFTGHLDGGSYMSSGERKELRSTQKSENAKKN